MEESYPYILSLALVLRVKVTVYLHGCLEYKRCSASGLKCRTSYETIATILQKNKLSDFSRLLNASNGITFWLLHVKANFVFRLFDVFPRFLGQSAKEMCLRFAIFNFSEKLQNVFKIGLKIME